MSNAVAKKLRSKPFEYVSLFSGCGGFDLGFAQAGFKCVGAVDIDKKALAVHERNLAGPVYHFDLSNKTLPAQLPDHVDVVLAGSPCQGFSTLGKRQLNDPRNSLLIAGGLAAIALKAKVFVAENVLTVKSGEHRKYWDELEQLLKRSQYRTEEIIIDSRDVGLAQSRRRVFLLAWRTHSIGGVPHPQSEGRNLREALDGIEGLPNHRPAWLVEGSIEHLIARRIPRGHKLSNVRNGVKSVHTWDIPEVFGAISKEDQRILTEIISIRRTMRVRSNGDADPLDIEFANKKFGAAQIARLLGSGYLKVSEPDNSFIDLANRFNGKYRRLAWESHSITVDTRFCNPKYYLHPDANRGFSTREAARLQGFPDDFIFSDTNHDHTLIGNAVAPPVALHLANFVRGNLLNGT